MFVPERYILKDRIIKNITDANVVKFGYDGFGELVYYSHYSRIKPDGSQENWTDTCTRVVNGVLSIRKSWILTHSLRWDIPYWDNIAEELFFNIYTLRLLPPGRSLWVQGTDYVYSNGSLALNNCAASKIGKDYVEDICWIMDALMCGAGVGIKLPELNDVTKESLFKDLFWITPLRTERYTIDDSREGWVDSIRELFKSYKEQYKVDFDYSLIRKKGEKIKGFGGVASGYKPLELLHNRIRDYIKYFIHYKDKIRFFADVINAIGCCIIAGNVRRSAELLLGDVNSDTFMSLKDYKKYPEREEIGFMSNNTVDIKSSEDLSKLKEITERIIENGEPGLRNAENIYKYERFGEIGRSDKADLNNPCGEIPLEDKELCNLVEIFPSKARNKKEFLNMCKLATIYATTVSLFPTHSVETNEVIARNRRIGISLSGITDWLDVWNATKIVRFMREGYSFIKECAKVMNAGVGVPPPIRLTTVKPSGTVSLLGGVSPGMHFPSYRFAKRRMRVDNESRVLKLCEESGLDIEDDVYTKGTKCVVYPIYTGDTRNIKDVSTWEQFSLLSLLQREWADNMVSCTISFKKHEEIDLERMLAYFFPTIKSVSLLPYKEDVYPQMPYEGITEECYIKMKEKLKPIKWKNLIHSDGIETKYCSNDSCEVINV